MSGDSINLPWMLAVVLESDAPHIGDRNIMWRVQFHVGRAKSKYELTLDIVVHSDRDPQGLVPDSAARKQFSREGVIGSFIKVGRSCPLDRR